MSLLSRIFPPAGRRRFAHKVVGALRRAGVPDSIEFDAQEFRIRIGGEDGLRMYLDNAYSDYCAAPVFQRRQVIARYIQFASAGDHEPPATFEDAAPHLLPQVRSRAFFANLKISTEARGEALPEVPLHDLCDDLIVHLAVDTPDAVMSVSDEMIAGWGVTLDEALLRARDNLWKISNEKFESPRSGLFVSPWRDNHDANRLSLHDLIWQLEAKGSHVAFVPNRDVLIVTGSEDIGGLTAAAELAMPALRDTRPISGYAFRLDDTTWTTWLPPVDSPAYWPLKKLALLTQDMDYGDQKAHLEQLQERTDEDVFHASLTVVEEEDTKHWFSWCSWSEGVPSTLPRADRVAFIRDPGGEPQTLGMAPWDTVQTHAGDLMKPMDMYPERWDVDQFPDEAMLDAIGPEPV